MEWPEVIVIAMVVMLAVYMVLTPVTILNSKETNAVAFLTMICVFGYVLWKMLQEQS